MIIYMLFSQEYQYQKDVIYPFEHGGCLEG